MLEDRDYMRAPAYAGPRMSFTIALLIANAVVFLAELAAPSLPNGLDLEWNYFALSLPGLEHGFVWQLLTFQFMHDGFLHILCNSLAIYFFGQPVETALGPRRFLTLYFSSGAIGGLVQMLFAFLFPSFDVPVVGASAGAAGLVAAFAVMHWSERFTLFLYFVIPISLRGKTLLWGSIGLALALMLIPNTHLANAAHLGGLLAGFLYVRKVVPGDWHLPQWRLPPRREKPREYATKRAGKGPLWRSAAPSPGDESTEDFVSSEVDPILDKISAHGIHSLTAHEREVLEKARKKMSGR